MKKIYLTISVCCIALMNVFAQTPATISLTSANDVQSICINNPISDIAYSVSGGGTDATTVGLPTGVSASFSAGFVTISGTPSVAGTYNYTVTTIGGSPDASLTGSIIVYADAAISLTSGNDVQSVCINTAITPITYSVGGGASGASIGGLPIGIVGVFQSGVFTITGTPSVAGTYDYTVTTSGTCFQTTATGNITVNPDATLSLTSVIGSDAQSVCVNNAITDITYQVWGSGTGASIGGLPIGIVGFFQSGVFTITGTPSVAGTYDYTVTTSGTCFQTTATGNITVNPDATLSLTSAVGSDAQTLCINTAITPITYQIFGGGNGATVAGLPVGINWTYSGAVLTIRGTPTVAGVFGYTVATTGTCAQTTLTGSITVNSPGNCSAYYATRYDTIHNTFTLTLDSATIAFAASYNWSFGDSTYSALSTPSHVYTVDTVYDICLKVFSAANDSATYCVLIGKDYLGHIFRTSGFTVNVVKSTTTGIASLSDENSITVYPNPTSGVINITLAQAEKAQIKITDVLGNSVYSSILQGTGQIDLSNQANGVYFISIGNEGGIVNKKIVISK